MKAQVLTKIGSPLQLQELPEPQAGAMELKIEVEACGICRTDLHVVDGELPHVRCPIIPGHQIVGKVVALGQGVTTHQVGQRVGVPWLGSTCGHCYYCAHEQENLCDTATYTGYQVDGGFAQYCVADSRYCFVLDPSQQPAEVAPLLCAGLIGYRALNKIPHAQKIGFYGFGASAHILTQVCHYQRRRVYAFTKANDIKTQQFAKQLGAVWAGDPSQTPSEQLDAAIIFAPVGDLVPTALSHIRKGGTVVCAGIHMSDIPSFAYKYLWEERKIESVANLTRKDGEEFLALAPKVPVKTHVTQYAFEQVNQALEDLRHGRFQGAAVIRF